VFIKPLIIPSQRFEPCLTLLLVEMTPRKNPARRFNPHASCANPGIGKNLGLKAGILQVILVTFAGARLIPAGMRSKLFTT
jgi:hypothetical protein